jgi:hypothetical protein
MAKFEDHTAWRSIELVRPESAPGKQIVGPGEYDTGDEPDYAKAD